MMGSSTTLAMNPSLYNKLSYDPADLAPIGLVGAAYFVLVTNPSVPAKTLPELIAYIKSKPPARSASARPARARRITCSWKCS